jgi:hypothetical protein
MRILTTIIVGLLFGAIFIACSSKTAATGPDKSAPIPNNPAFPAGADQSLLGVYHYTGFDDKGVKIIEGRVTVDSVEPRKIDQETQMIVTGTWDLEEVVHRDHIGMQVGLGKLDGSIKGDEVVIDLNPNIDDANVYLRGRLTGNRLAGTWSFNGEGGPISHGTFEAVKE